MGPHGEAVIDLVASDALAAGFGTIVLVLGPSTGPAIRYHVEHTWPAAVDVRFATQPAPLGTVHAVLSASDHVGDAPYGVGNADDIYGTQACAQLAAHLQAHATTQRPGGLPAGRRRHRLLAGHPGHLPGRRRRHAPRGRRAAPGDRARPRAASSPATARNPPRSRPTPGSP